MSKHDDWFDEPKKKKSKESDEDIIEALGGKKKLKQIAEGMEEYVDLFGRLIIVQDSSPEETERNYKEVKKMIKDMKKGKTYMFDKDAVLRYAEIMEDM